VTAETSAGGSGGPDGHGPGPNWLRPQRSSSRTSPDLPESPLYRLKRTLLGPPLVSEELTTERLGKPIALAVLSSDVMSSAAYATESILTILIPAAGIGAFMLITPVTALLLVVLGVVCLCYRDVVQHYPVSGGSYVVSRENFGHTVALIPGSALLCSYTLTVAVSIAAGVDAVISAFPAVGHPVLLSCLFVILLSFGNLRGLREAGHVFAIPTYWFLASMAAVIVAGVTHLVLDGHLLHEVTRPGQLPLTHAGGGLLLGAGVFIFLRAFANGGSAMTGMEAISNAVPLFRDPQIPNARRTLLLMASILGVMFLSVSVFSALIHAVPYHSGTPTVLSQIGRQVFGTGLLANVAFYSLQLSTALILILGANTSFNGFPQLVSSIANDAYLPRPFTTRGHRLVYSNGILALAGLSVLLLVVTGAKVTSLIPLYACTVFTGFTMAGAGMVRYHLTHHDPDRRRRLVSDGTSFVASAVVTLIFVVTEFSRGAWAVVIVIPLIVFGLSRTNRRYQAEGRVLAEESTPAATKAPTLRHQVVIVLVDRIDLATARALQLARSLALGNELRAVHFMIDDARAARLSKAWTRIGLGQISLEVIEVPDRRLTRAATELADDLASDGSTEVLMVLPRRAYRGLASRLLHDHTADRIVAAVTQVKNVSATIAPFDVTGASRRHSKAVAAQEQTVGAGPAPDSKTAASPSHRRDVEEAKGVGVPVVVPGTTPIGEVTHRGRAKVAGRLKTVRVQSWSGVPAFECIVVDGSGALTLVFLGRRAIPGLNPGTKLMAEGTIGSYQGRLAMLNPTYELLASSAGGGRAATG
jgi:amino acid transporter